MSFVEVSMPSDFVAQLTIKRPEALNALNQQVLFDLKAAIDELLPKFPDQVRGLVITGFGDKAFVAGADIKEMQGLTTSGAVEFSELGQKIFMLLEELPFPVMAAVNGFALGGGCELALACDWIYASENAELGLPEVGLGLIPGFGGTARLVEKIGPSRASELVFSAQRLKASDALAWGLVNRVLPQADLMTQAVLVLTGIAKKGPQAVAQAKRVIQSGRKAWLSEALQTEAENFGDLFLTQDVREGLAAFLEKRKPSYQGR